MKLLKSKSYNWEELIYKKKKQYNKYPFDWVVSNTYKYFQKTHNKSVFDLGCGTGNHLEFFQNLKFKQVCGCDISKTAIDFSKKKLKKKNLKIFVSDFKNLELPMNTFDLFLDRGSITHTTKKDAKELMNKIFMSLKINGYFFSSIFSINHQEANKGNEFYAFKKETGSKKGVFTSFYSKKEIKKLFHKFHFLSLIEDKRFNHLNKTNSSMWYIILKKI